MRLVGEGQLDDLAVGAAVLGTGGGGNPYLGALLAKRAIRKHGPVVDADGMGRAFPEIQMVTATLCGVAATPMALADEKGNTAVIDTVDNHWAERLARSLAIDMGCVAKIALYPQSGRRTEAGFAKGQARIEGAGSSVVVRFQNEHLVALRDGEVAACVPDLIIILDAETGVPITTEELRCGLRVTVIAAACDPRWRTPEGLALVGPRAFGYDLDFTPIEHRDAGA